LWTRQSISLSIFNPQRREAENAEPLKIPTLNLEGLGAIVSRQSDFSEVVD
jgi:hypothetical protein